MDQRYKLTYPERTELIVYEGLLHQHRDMVQALQGYDKKIKSHETQLQTLITQRAALSAEYGRLLKSIQAERQRLQGDHLELFHRADTLLQEHHQFATQYTEPKGKKHVGHTRKADTK